MTIKLFCILFLVLVGCGRHHNTHRSPLRKTSYNLPTLVIADSRTGQSYARTSSSYKKYPIFTVFDHSCFMSYQMPTDGITYADSTNNISGDTITKLLEDIIHNIVHRKSFTSECTVIRDSNFNYQIGCGLLILKINKYPFVIKLFRETAKSFINPYGKGLAPISFFFMSGGCNRHIAGLTRIPNREYIKNIIEQHPLWKNMVKIPRKWYWVPDPIDWLVIDGYNIDGIKHLQTCIPATYAIIEDYIDEKDHHFLTPNIKENIILELCALCTLHIDPHIKNFIVTQNNPCEKPCITIVDTEDHHCMTGITNPTPCTSYFEWYTMLAGKFLKNLLLNVKTTLT